jgi:predicted nucleic acid-binding protein
LPPYGAYGLCNPHGTRRLDNLSKKHLLLQSERDRLLSIIKVLPWLPESPEYFGSIKADLENRGKIIDDFGIAASMAISHKYDVITANMEHFRRINGLESKNWK